MKHQRIIPKPGQESVWDYPRPPRLEPTSRRIRVVIDGCTLADTKNALRLLETSHPPTYYIPPSDIAMQYLLSSRTQSFCEWKGQAQYLHWKREGREIFDVAWLYPSPVKEYAALAHHIAFYPQKVSECWVDEEQARPQPGRFYGGWVTSDLVGPFKGEPGTELW